MAVILRLIIKEMSDDNSNKISPERVRISDYFVFYLLDQTTTQWMTVCFTPDGVMQAQGRGDRLQDGQAVNLTGMLHHSYQHFVNLVNQSVYLLEKQGLKYHLVKNNSFTFAMQLLLGLDVRDAWYRHLAQETGTTWDQHSQGVLSAVRWYLGIPDKGGRMSGQKVHSQVHPKAHKEKQDNAHHTHSQACRTLPVLSQSLRAKFAQHPQQESNSDERDESITDDSHESHSIGDAFRARIAQCQDRSLGEQQDEEEDRDSDKAHDAYVGCHE